ncbi:MAG TPA: FtsX-like permease family protein, partial [Vicinamibacterales bacterium]|nr:FtsX-like permease family protein [Vicinamibacterales bacterium]
SQQRTAELSLRSALGASKGRLVRQMLTESSLLALAGGVVGAALAAAGTRLLLALQPNLPRLDRIGVDGAALAFTAGLSMLTGIAFGLVPALSQSRRGGLQTIAAVTGRASGGPSLRARWPLISVQVALSVTLAIGAGLLARSATALAAVTPGFASSGVLTLRVTLPSSSYPDRATTRRFLEDALADARSLPGVISAGATTHLPLVDRTGDWGLMIEGLPERDENGRRPNADWSVVSAGYFEAMGIRVIEGRTYGPRDAEGAPLVTIINERTAREYFPGRSAIGRRMRMSSTLDPVDREIIGVVADVRHDGLDQEAARQMFLPLAQFPAGQDSGGGSVSLVVRTAGDPTALTGSIRARLRDRDPNVPVALVRTLDDIVTSSTSVSRLYLVLFGVFSALAIAIVSAGVYGVASYLVATRRRELAVRRALGASSASIVGLVLKGGTLPALVGVLAGVLGALALSQLIDSLLFGVTSRDPMTFVLMPLAVLAVTGIANFLPARAAVRDSPAVGLRQ